MEMNGGHAGDWDRGERAGERGAMAAWGPQDL